MTRQELEGAVEAAASGCLIRVFAQPRASRNALCGMRENELKVALTAPPVDGEANKALCEFFSSLAGLSKRAVEVVKGEASRHKVVGLAGIDRERLLKIILEK